MNRTPLHGRRPRRPGRVAPWLAVCLFATLACSRAVNVGSQPTPVFAIAVTNDAGAELVVSYDDGSGPRALGAVASGRTERFVIAAPASTTIRVSGRTADGSRTVGPLTAELRAGQTTPVTLR